MTIHLCDACLREGTTIETAGRPHLQAVTVHDAQRGNRTVHLCPGCHAFAHDLLLHFIETMKGQRDSDMSYYVGQLHEKGRLPASPDPRTWEMPVLGR